jgi:predicted nucleic acid-binding protein
MILVDTSVWVDFLRRGCESLEGLLEKNQVLAHPSVIGELACGHLKNRSEILGLLHRLPKAANASDAEVLLFIEQHKLMGGGIGYIDAHLLASARLSHDAQLWTFDKRLAALASELSVAH